jgi:hypothetical protein
MNDLLSRELDTYASQREELLRTAEGRFVLIHGVDILGTYESKTDAIDEGYRRLGNVPFLVKQVVPVEVPQNFVSNQIAL